VKSNYLFNLWHFNDAGLILARNKVPKFTVAFPLIG
jgi:hypothetical protein